jgi:N-carbamoylputrescine amidase
MSSVSIGIIQTSINKDFKKNLEKFIKLIRQAKKKGAEIICLPELFLYPYFCQTENHKNFSLAEKIPGPTSEVLSKLCKELKVSLIAPIFEKKTSGLYHNSCFVIDEKGKNLGTYRKLHIPDDPLFYEKFYFTPGDLGFKTFQTKSCKIGTLICWDQWFPEAARATAIKGAQVLFYPTAIGWHPHEKKRYGKTQLESWLTIQRSHAIANGVFVVAVNRIGLEKVGKNALEFWGHSIIYDPSGNIVFKASANKECVIVKKIDLNKIDTVRQHWPFLRDRRIDNYKALLKNPY